MGKILLLLFLIITVRGEQVCKLRSVFGHVVDYKCPEYGNSLLKYCCGPYKEGKCCMEPNPNLEAEEEQILKEGGHRNDDLIALLTFLAAGVGVLLGCCGFLLCCCRCCPCCYLARRKREREEEREQEVMMPLESVAEDAALAPGYSAPPWPPQHTAPQQWPYNPSLNNQPSGYPSAPPGYAVQPPYNNNHSLTQPPAYPQLPYPTYT